MSVGPQCMERSDRRWLVRAVLPSADPPGSNGVGPVFRVSRVAVSPPGQSSSLPPHVSGELFLGDGPLRGRFWGFVAAEGGTLEPLDWISMVGPGMYRVLPENSRALDDPAPAAADIDRWSRTIGALNGVSVWRRVVRLKVAVIGASRTGTLAGVTLARHGLRELTIIDDDDVENNSLGEADAFTEADVGHPKAAALAKHIRGILPSSGPYVVNPVIAPITAPEAIQAAKNADVLFLCVDHDSPRLCASMLGVYYQKVVVDIGSGVHFGAGPVPGPRPDDVLPERTMGADLRLVVPGTPGCLLCRGGGLARGVQAVEDLSRGSSTRRPSDFRGHRAGSLRALNQASVGLAVQLLVDLVCRRVSATTWLRLEFSSQGILSVRYPAPAVSSAECPLCARAGLGDAAFNGGPKVDVPFRA